MPVCNYDFVPFPLYPKIDYITDFRKRMGEYSGYLELKITALDPLHIGSGFCHMKNGKLFSETLKEQDRLIIPGSSLKGAVRQISRAVSDGCIDVRGEKEKKKDKNGNKSYVLFENEEQKRRCFIGKGKCSACIVCDLYGMMSLASKVRFSDFVSDSVKTEIISVASQYSPDITKKHYKTWTGSSNVHKGYKFYKTNCQPMPVSADKDVIEAVPKGTVFTGTIHFRGLDDEQLELLTYSLGLGEQFSPKLGGYKSVGLGTVKVNPVKFIVNGETKDAKEWAQAYKNRYYNLAAYCFDALEEIMEYREV